MERWHDLGTYCQETFGHKLFRVPLDGGFSCPNRDGTLNTGGCIFCDEGGSGDFAIHYDGSLLKEDDLSYNHQNAGAGNYIGYFQAYTSTYGPVDKLQKLFEGALSDPLFAGISIGTRPDCLGDDVCALLGHLKHKYPDKFIWIELGLQTMHDDTAAFIHRGYSLPVFDEAVRNMHALYIPVIVHLILGLPHENEDMVLQTIAHMNEMHVDGIKLQLLQYLKNTVLGMMYEDDVPGLWHLGEADYVHLVCQCLGHLDPSIVIHRLTGDPVHEMLIGPVWALDKRHVLNAIRHEMKQEQLVQGCLISKGGNDDE